MVDAATTSAMGWAARVCFIGGIFQDLPDFGPGIVWPSFHGDDLHFLAGKASLEAEVLVLVFGQGQVGILGSFYGYFF